MRRISMILALGLAVVACSGVAETADGEETPGATVAGASDGRDGVLDEGGQPAEQPSIYGDVDVAFDVLVGDRPVIRQASLQLHAGDTRAAFDDIVALTEGAGGFVATANVQPPGGEDRQPDISIVLRVPADQLTATMRAIKGVADDVVSESQDAQDVSAQFVDLEARLTNLQALETELRSLLEEVRDHPDADPEKLLRVFTELGSVRGQIEQIQGQINYLADLTDLATVTVGITQTPAAVPIVAQPWAPAEAVQAAARNLVTSLQNMADWAIGFVVYTLPILILALAIPGLILVFAYRKWWKGRDSSRPSSPTPAEA